MKKETAHILIAPDKFRGSLTARQAAEAIAGGLRATHPDWQVTITPAADGGESSLDTVSPYLHCRRVRARVADPLMRPITTYYGHCGTRALIEMAKASGLSLLAETERNPEVTTTLGTGQLIEGARRHARQIYVFAGGSATFDGGMGIAHALGFRFLNAQGHILAPIGRNMAQVHSVTAPEAAPTGSYHLLYDVGVPPAAAVDFAAQKGASKEQIARLAAGLENLIRVVSGYSGQDLSELTGGGAAGGIGICMRGLLGADLHRAFEQIAAWTGLETAIRRADLVITGEGKLDRHSFSGKVVGQITKLAGRYGKPVVVIAGVADPDVAPQGITVHQLADWAHDTKDSMRHAAHYLHQWAAALERP